MVQLGLGVLAVALLAVALHREREDIGEALERLRVADVIGAALLVLVGLVANFLSWREVLGGLGSRLPLRSSARVFLVAQLGKYLPGSVWPVLAQIELARDHNVPRLRSGAAAIAALLLGMAVGGVVAVTCLVPTSSSDLVGWWAAAAVALGVVVLHPAVLRRLIAVALRVGRRPSVEMAIDGGALLRAVLWSLLMWIALGAHVYVLARGLGGDDAELALVATGAYAAAWITGLLVVFAPAGAGAREAALVVALGSVLERPDALAVAIVSRFLTLLGDLVCGGVAALLTRSRSTAGGPEDSAVAGPAPGGPPVGSGG